MTLLDRSRQRLAQIRPERRFALQYRLFVAEQMQRERPAQAKPLLEVLAQDGEWLDSQHFRLNVGRWRKAFDELESQARELTWPRASEQARIALDDLAVRQGDLGPAVTGWEDSLRQFAHDSGRIFVVSDAHLGVEQSDRARFEDVLALCSSGDQLILLGDILDFWIAGLDQKWEYETIRRHWIWLYRRLAILRDDGVEIHYVPGNHDPFVFTLYSVGRLRWGDWVQRFSGFVKEFSAGLARDYRLTQFASIHYPYFSRTVNGDTWLFTHGHMNEWLWQLFGPNTAAQGIVDRPSIWAGVTSLSTAFAHRFASQLRRVFLSGEAAAEVEDWVADVGILITHELIEKKEDARRALAAQNWPEFASELELAFEYYVVANPDDPRVGDIRKSLVRLQQQYQSRDLQIVRDRERKWIAKHRNNFNYAFLRDDNDDVASALRTQQLSELESFTHFTCGHYHKPRLLQVPEILADSGALLKTVATVLQINPDGWIGRPEF